MPKLKLVPLGEVPDYLIADIIEELRGMRTITEQSAALTLPAETYNPIRHQHLSEKVLEFLLKNSNGRTLGITDKDMYTGDLSYIFGQAQLNGAVAVVSIHRLDPRFYREDENQELFKERAIKECLHEVGHLLGLRHCENVPCVMGFSNTIMDVDTKGKELCNSCRNLLRL